MPKPLDDHVRSRMERQKTSGTAAELAVRRALHARGFRFRVNIRPVQEIRSRADVVFTRRKVAVYVDGCFWHGCPEHFIPPKNNAAWWREKIAANRSRDARVQGELEGRGWSVVRIWEHVDVDSAVDLVFGVIGGGLSEG